MTKFSPPPPPPPVRESKTVLDADSTPWIRIPASASESMELQLRIPIACEIPDSLSCISDSIVLDFGFHNKKFSDFPPFE